MLKKLIAPLFDVSPGEPDRRHTLQVASAAILIEVARADFEASEEELAALIDHLKSAFQLTPDEVGALVDTADNRVAEAVSLHEFTTVIKKRCSAKQRCELIGQMWQVAYADGVLHHYEEHLIRRVSELLYVAHTDFIRLKHEARPQ